MANIFEQSSRRALRFIIAGIAGTIACEKLWGIKLENLDETYVALDKALTNTASGSLLNKKQATQEESDNQLRLEILKHIITVRLKEQTDRERSIVAKQERQKKADDLRAAIAAKTHEANKGKTLEELEKELAELEG